MKRIIALAAVAVLLSSASVAPVQAISEGGPMKPNKSDGSAKASLFCKTIDKTAAKTLASLEKAPKDRAEQIGGLKTKNKDKQLRSEEAVKRTRAVTDKKFEKDIEAMQAKVKAEDTAKTEAIKTYQSTIRAAMEERRTANDQSRDKYKTSLDQLIDKRDQDREAAFKMYEEKIGTAVAAAKESCKTNPKDSVAIREAFLQKKKEALTERKEHLKTIGKIGDQVVALNATRKAEFNASGSVFRDKKAAAKSQLQSVLKTKLIDSLKVTSE